MPDDRVKMGPVKTLGVNEYSAFIAWLKKTFGEDVYIPPNEEGIVQNTAYRYWVDTGGLETVPSLGQLPPEQAKLEAIRPFATAKEEPQELLIAGGRLIQMPDGTYQDPATRMTIPNEEAQRIIDEYNASAGGAEGKKASQYEQWTMRFQEQQVEEARKEATLAREQENRLSLAKSQAQMRLEIQQAISDASGPSDWITRWELIHGVLPRTQLQQIQQSQIALLEEAQSKIGAERLALEQRANQLQGQWQIQEAALRGVAAPPSFYNTAMERQVRTPETGRMGLNETESAWTPEMIAEAQAWEFAMNQAAGNRAAPPAPSWLAQFAPGQTTGKPITREKLTTPSGQQWTATPWSVREGLKGYADWAGFEPLTETLERVALMQPLTPSGAGRTGWRPARQRA